MATFNVDSLDFVDDETARFGADPDFDLGFDSANSRLELADLTNGTTGFVPQDVGTDLVGGKYAQTVAEGKILTDTGNVFTNFQKALDDATSWVRLGPGKFDGHVSTSKTLTIVGSGDRTTVRGTKGGNVIKLTGDNTKLAHLSIEQTNNNGLANAIRSVSANSLFHNISIEFQGGTAFNHSGENHSTNPVTVSNLRVSGYGNENSAINTVSNRKTIVIGCTVYNSSDQGIYISGDDSIVSNCHVMDCDFEGILIRDGDSIVMGNRVDNCGGEGIRVFDNDNIAVNNILSNTNGINDTGTGNIVQDNKVL